MGSSLSTEYEPSPEEYSTLFQIPKEFSNVVETTGQTTDNESLKTPDGESVKIKQINQVHPDYGVSKKVFLQVSEVTFWRSLFVLAHNSLEYDKLLKAIQSKNYEKLCAFFEFNDDMLNEIEKDLNNNFPRVRRAVADPTILGFLNKDVHGLRQRIREVQRNKKRSDETYRAKLKQEHNAKPITKQNDDDFNERLRMATSGFDTPDFSRKARRVRTKEEKRKERKKLKVKMKADRREFEAIQNRINENMVTFGTRLEEAEEDVKKKLDEQKELHQQIEEVFMYELEEVRNNLREQMEKLNKEHAELMDKLKQEREKIEKETEEVTSESLEEMHVRAKIYLNWVEMKFRFEEKEAEWRRWLNVLKATIVGVKTQFGRIKQKATFSENELYQLHLTLHSAHTLLYDAYFLIKDLSARAPDRLFLKILQRDLKQNANFLFMMLNVIDKKNGNVVEALDCLFEDYETMEIPSTWKLRELERTTPSDEFDGIEIEDPVEYTSRSGTEDKMSDEDGNSPQNHDDNAASDSEHQNHNGYAKEDGWDIITGNEANHSSGIALEKRNELADIEQQIKNEQIECEKEKKRLRDAAAEYELMANKVHGAKMLEKAEEKKRVGAEGEQRLNELAQEEIELEKMVLEKQNDLKAVIMNNTFTLMNAQNDEQRYEDFRRNCRRLVNSFSKFSGALSKAELNLVSVRDQIERHVILTNEPNMNSVLRILREFTENLQLFTPDGAYEPLKFGELRKEVLGMATELNNGLTRIDSKIQAYKQAPNAHTDMSSFSITELHETVSETFRKLQMAMLEFNVPASDRFDQALRNQIETLALDQSRLITGQLNIASSSRDRTGQNRLEQASGSDADTRGGSRSRSRTVVDDPVEPKLEMEPMDPKPTSSRRPGTTRGSTHQTDRAATKARDRPRWK